MIIFPLFVSFVEAALVEPRSRVRAIPKKTTALSKGDYFVLGEGKKR